jgi:dTDP-4-dehydrorhamnose 3,5-epimerase
MLNDVRPLALDGVYELRPARHGDDRGFFSEVWSREAMAAAGFDIEFVQDNHSFSVAGGLLSGALWLCNSRADRWVLNSADRSAACSFTGCCSSFS